MKRRRKANYTKKKTKEEKKREKEIKYVFFLKFCLVVLFFLGTC